MTVDNEQAIRNLQRELSVLKKQVQELQKKTAPNEIERIIDNHLRKQGARYRM